MTFVIRATETWSVIVEYPVEAESLAAAYKSYLGEEGGDSNNVGFARLEEVIGADSDPTPLIQDEDGKWKVRCQDGSFAEEDPDMKNG